MQMPLSFLRMLCFSALQTRMLVKAQTIVKISVARQVCLLCKYINDQLACVSKNDSSVPLGFCTNIWLNGLLLLQHTDEKCSRWLLNTSRYCYTTKAGVGLPSASAVRPTRKQENSECLPALLSVKQKSWGLNILMPQ